MGSGIAQVFAQHRFRVILYDVDETTIGRAQNKIAADLEQLVQKNKLSAVEKEETLHRMRFTVDLEDCRADLIVEAVIEDAEVKSALLNKLRDLNGEQTIIATNTSSLSVNSLTEKLTHPQRFAGLHFFNPAPVMKLVEIVTTPFTSADTINTIGEIVKLIGKTAVICKDSPGFIVNRVARPYYLEALRLVENNNTDMATVDILMEATGFKMGPFKLMDLIGNDINYAVSCIVYNALGKPSRLQPSPLQEQKVKEGSLGRKTGKGYYEYPG